MSKKLKGLLITSCVIFGCALLFSGITIYLSYATYHSSAGVIVPFFMIPLFFVSLFMTCILGAVFVVLFVIFIVRLTKNKKESKNNEQVK